VRSRAIYKQLRGVEQLSDEKTTALFPPDKLLEPSAATESKTAD